MPDDLMPLRERKKERTRLAIQAVALDMFERDGYGRTTIEQVAAAAEVSPSTVYRYFETKEALVFWDRWDPRILDFIRDRPRDEEPVDALLAAGRALLLEALDTEGELIRRRLQLSLDVPELRAHMHTQFDIAAGLIVEVLAERSGRRSDDLELRVLVHTMLTALMLAMHDWAQHAGEPTALVERALAVVIEGGRLPVQRPQAKRRAAPRPSRRSPPAR